MCHNSILKIKGIIQITNTVKFEVKYKRDKKVEKKIDLPSKSRQYQWHPPKPH